MNDSEIKSQAFQTARLRSERARVLALMGVLVSLLALLLIRARLLGETWPYVVLLGVMTAFETVWLKLVDRAIRIKREVSTATWTANVCIESLLPTTALILQTHTSFVGPYRALTSPAVLTYFLFIILSTLHLNPALSRLSGVFSAAGYAGVSIYVFRNFPDVAAQDKLLVYGTSFSYAALLLLGGFAAGAVARQIRFHVVAALHEADSRAKIAQLKHDLGVARSIQQGLLPAEPPKVAGFDIAGWNLPADETGGDYFDWQHLPDGRVAVTIADVTGHGIGSALCMAACRAYARAGFVIEPDLRSFLGRLNQLLHHDLPPEKFVTLAAGLLSPSEATLHLISAGHGPLLFYSSSEDCFVSYDAQGLPLGLLPRAPYGAAQELKFGHGDILILVTDGFLEWGNAGDEDFGEHRLKQVVRANRNLSSEAIISELYSEVLKFAGAIPQQDDLTALVVKRM